MTRRLIVILIVTALVFPAGASATPVFDCAQPEIRREYPAQCPELPDPLLTGGGGGRGSAGECDGLCGIIRDVLGHIPGIGGII